ncbi:chemokine-like factor super family 5 (predicted), isoform CRA_a [Rattus norvegicus]|uniref:Chemokine-like factor super family 5 (Predicted), isoform CRA_a n=1 Tax=Rattus norvegicus TaxID=10116 RepID=A6KGX7_RAT|nr:chemokine-like factor super family 5 (predicted), isoform CRA_a [Rattus norvegicus]
MLPRGPAGQSGQLGEAHLGKLALGTAFPQSPTADPSFTFRPLSASLTTFLFPFLGCWESGEGESVSREPHRDVQCLGSSGAAPRGRNSCRTPGLRSGQDLPVFPQRHPAGN